MESCYTVGKRLRNPFPGRSAIPTIIDVAQRAGVSTATVSHVMNNTRYVSDALRTRVSAAIAELNYQPNGVARSLRRKQTRTIGMVIPDNCNPFFAEVTRGIEDASFEQGYNVILCNSDGDAEKELDYLELLFKKRVDGIVLVSAGASQATVDVLAEQGRAVVIVDREISGLSADLVMTDNRQGGYQAVSYLLGLGHRRIACIAGPSPLTASAGRLAGYRSALTGAGLTVDEGLILAGDFQSRSGYMAMQSFLTLADRPTAVFACNDMMAMGVICAIHQAGLKVPEDISVMGFDDISLASFTCPPLTTVAQAKHEMGVLAFGMLRERMRDGMSSPRTELLTTELVVRSSCGPSRPG
jgi:LacI family transcriptional regulator